VPVVHLHLSERDLPAEALVGTEEELLSGLAAGVEGAADLGSAERAIVEHAAVFAGKGHALGHTLVDDCGGEFRQAVDIGLTAAEIAAFNRVIEKAENAIAVVLIVLGGIDPALGGD